MSSFRLTTPEGYFEKSLEKTMASADRIHRRRRALLYSCTAIVLLAGVFLSIYTHNVIEAEKEYLAQQAEIARIDIFLEVNQ